MLVVHDGHLEATIAVQAGLIAELWAANAALPARCAELERANAALHARVAELERRHQDSSNSSNLAQVADRPRSSSTSPTGAAAAAARTPISCAIGTSRVR